MNNIITQSIEINGCLNISGKDIIISSTQNQIKENLNENFLAGMLFDLKRRENDGTIYKYIWVKEFRKLIWITVELVYNKKKSKNWRDLKLYSIPTYDVKWLKWEIKFGKKAEVIHGIAALASLSWIAIIMAINWNIDYINVICFLIGFYLAILQRYNRGRLLYLLRKKNHNSESTNQQ